SIGSVGPHTYRSGSTPGGCALQAPTPAPPAPVSNSQGRVKKAKLKLKLTPYQARRPNECGFTRDKWSDVDSEHSPPSIVIWKEARSAIDQAPHRVRADVPKPAVYPFPDPALFMTVKSDERKALYFRNWLLSCPAWINCVYAQICSDTVPTAQMWRNFLYCMGEVHQTSSTITRSAKDIEAAARLFGPEFLDLHSSAADADTLAAVSFQDIVLDLCDFTQINKEILRRVIWDLYDLSFCFDFLMLDRALCPEAWSSDFEERIDLIAAVFGNKSILANWTTPFPLENQGLVALNWKDRRHSIEAFRVVLMSWPLALQSTHLPPTATSDDT
ncbi:hypothetical protein BU15DRAFT_69667, partial [Melanogaster broomeanus]